MKNHNGERINLPAMMAEKHAAVQEARKILQTAIEARDDLANLIGEKNAEFLTREKGKPTSGAKDISALPCFSGETDPVRVLPWKKNNLEGKTGYYLYVPSEHTKVVAKPKKGPSLDDLFGGKDDEDDSVD